MRNFLLEKSCTKFGEETRPFLKNQNRTHLWIKGLNSYSLFLLNVQVEDYQNIETEVLTTCFYFKLSVLKNRKRSGTSLPPSFSALLLKKNIFHVIFY